MTIGVATGAQLIWRRVTSWVAACKYLFSTLRVEVSIVEQTPLRLKASGGVRAEMYLRGALAGSDADSARSAVGLAVRHLVGSTDRYAFDSLAPVSLGGISPRIAAYRTEVQRLVAAAIDDGGRDGLLRLCRSGIA